MLKDGFYNMDCFEGFKQISDKSVDMILCDLPYGTTQCSWDEILPFEQLWKEYKRIIKDNGAIEGRHGRTASGFYRSEILPDAREIIWQKSYYTRATQTIVRSAFFSAAVMAAAKARTTYRTVTK